MNSEQFVEKLAATLKERALFFSELLNEYSDVDYRSFLVGWGELRTRYELQRDHEGRYVIRAEALAGNEEG